MSSPKISIVTPTFRRPQEMRGLLDNLSAQVLLPIEVIVVDGAPADEKSTDEIVSAASNRYAFPITYIRFGGGTAVQRNVGVEAATGDFVALIDDDVRLDPDFLKNVSDIFSEDINRKVGGVVGYRTNQHFARSESQRWRWYKRLRLLSTYEPGRYDFQTGYPINSNMQPPFTGTRPVDFMTTACAVWRKEVFDSGLRFDQFFRDYGMLEDAHFSLRARKNWELLQSGDAHCEELHSPNGRVNRRKLGYKCVVNYYFVFGDIAGPLSIGQKVRFWRYQLFEFFRIGASAMRRRRGNDLLDLLGRLEGLVRILRGTPFAETSVDLKTPESGLAGGGN